MFFWKDYNFRMLNADGGGAGGTGGTDGDNNGGEETVTLTTEELQSKIDEAVNSRLARETSKLTKQFEVDANNRIQEALDKQKADAALSAEELAAKQVADKLAELEKENENLKLSQKLGENEAEVRKLFSESEVPFSDALKPILINENLETSVEAAKSYIETIVETRKEAEEIVRKGQVNASKPNGTGNQGSKGGDDLDNLLKATLGRK